jgi:hypothetical protein
VLGASDGRTIVEVTEPTWTAAIGERVFVHVRVEPGSRHDGSMCGTVVDARRVSVPHWIGTAGRECWVRRSV